MPKLLKCCKAQFFIISAALVITSISLAAFYLQSLFLPTVTSVSLKTEPEYIGQIKNVLCEFYRNEKNFDTQTFLAHLNELEEELTYYLAQQGILFSVKHEILKNKIRFWYNLTSFGFRSQTYVECG